MVSNNSGRTYIGGLIYFLEELDIEIDVVVLKLINLKAYLLLSIVIGIPEPAVFHWYVQQLYMD